MKLADHKRNVAAIEQGTWIGQKYGTPIPGMGDLCFKTRGASNADWQKLEDRLIRDVPPTERLAAGGLSAERRAAMFGRCLLECGVTDWDCIEGEDGQPVAYSRAQAEIFFITDPAYAELREAALWAAQMVGTAAAEALKVDAKN